MGPALDLRPGFDATVGEGGAPGDGPGVDAPVPPPSKADGVDVLIVVDNSPGMGAPQEQLGRDINALLMALDGLPGRPSYRVGIVSTDLGAGPYTNRSCPTAGGDGGLLLLRPGCPKPAGGVGFIERIAATSNIDGPLDSALACHVRLGEAGCGFEQPLESAYTALTGVNPGFLRPTAALALIILGNEDDCSAANTELYNPEATELGQYGSYRCFHHGVLCDGAPPPAAEGTVRNCQPGQAWLHPLAQRYVATFTGLKPPGWVSVAVIAGPAGQEIDVVEDHTSQGVVIRLDTVCVTDNSYAEPAVRLQAFAAAFGTLGTFESVCAESYSGALTQAIARLRAAFGPGS